MKKFQKGHPVELDQPLTRIPDVKSDIVSPRIGNCHGVLAPSYPGEDGFDELLYEVVRVRQDVSQNIWPTWFFEKYNIDPTIPEPLVDAGVRTAKDAAHIVHMDKPVDLGLVLLDYVSHQCPLQTPVDHLGVDFLARFPKYIDSLSANVYEALERAFEVKYFYMRPRPEEILGFNMTHYAEGCPAHPEYVAGHGAASGATYKTVSSYFNLNPIQDEVVKTTCIHFAMYRTLAGVHYADANLEGFKLGNSEN